MAADKTFLSLLDQASVIVPRVIEDADTHAVLEMWFAVVCYHVRHKIITVDDLLVLSRVAMTLAEELSDMSTTKIVSVLKETHVRKNAGYAGTINPDPWNNFRESERLGIDAFTGCMVRLSDKVRRIHNLHLNPEDELVGECMFDTAIDAASYALIAACLLIEMEDNNGS